VRVPLCRKVPSFSYVPAMSLHMVTDGHAYKRFPLIAARVPSIGSFFTYLRKPSAIKAGATARS
jgi:hypothetical protein